MAAISMKLQSIEQTLAARDRVDSERRHIDDERARIVTSKIEEVVHRVDEHGKRTTRIETKWEAFFGEQGAFRIVERGLKENGVKLDSLGEKLADKLTQLAIRVAGMSATLILITGLVIWLVKTK